MPEEVRRPHMEARVKQWNEYASDRIKRTNIRSLVTVAAKTSERKIILVRLATVLTRDDVIRLVAMEGGSLRELAVFTPVGRAFGDQLTETGGHLRGHQDVPCSCSAIRAFSRTTICSMRCNSSSSCCSVSPRDPAAFNASSLCKRACAWSET